MSVPKLRFRGFTEEWEKKKLGEITKRVKGNDGRMNLPTLTISAKNGWMRQEDRFSSNIAGAEQKNYTLLSKGELSYNHGNSKLAKYGVVYSLKHINEALVPKVYHSFKTTKFFYNLFIEYLFMSKIPDRELRKLISSGARMDGLLNIGYDEFMGINVILPEFEEQQKIGDFFMLLDKRIEQQEQKIALLKDYKKAMMQKIFSQKIRFKDENGNDYPDWEEKKLGEIVYRNSKKNKDQKYTLIQSISNKYGFVNQEDYFEDRRVGSLDVSNYYVINNGCFAYNPSRIDVGSLAYKNDNDISIISPLYVSFKGNAKHINDKFLLGWLFSHKFVGKLGRLFEGSVRNTLSYENLSTIDIETPCIAEQEKIALFLEVIDKNIENQELLLNELKEQKQGVLGKMFV